MVRMMLDKMAVADATSGEALTLAKVMMAGTATRSGLFFGSRGRGARTLNHTMW